MGFKFYNFTKKFIINILIIYKKLEILKKIQFLNLYIFIVEKFKY